MKAIVMQQQRNMMNKTGNLVERRTNSINKSAGQRGDMLQVPSHQAKILSPKYQNASGALPSSFSTLQIQNAT